MMHPLLTRQVKRFFGEQAEDLDPRLRAFIEAVDDTYRQGDSEMQAILQSFPDLFFRLDRDGRILDCKGGNPDDFVISRDQLIGKRIQDIPDRGAQRALREALHTNAMTHFPVSVEYCLRGNDSLKYYELRLVNVLQDQLIAIVRDITQQRHFAEVLDVQRLFLRQIIDQNPNFIFAKDREGRYRLVNQALADAYGTTVDHLLGKTDWEFHQDLEQVESFRKEDEEVLETLTEKVVPEVAITDKAGTSRWMQTIKRPILSPDGEEQMVLGVAMDITARKLAEESLKTRTEQILKHQDALHELALTPTDNLDSAVRNILHVSARALKSTRASVWLFNNDRTEINEEYLLTNGEFVASEPASLCIEDCPKYFEALDDYRTLSVCDALNDPRTHELASGYLKPHRIVSKLDACIRLHGDIIGVVSHEQTETTRKWTLEEEHFAASLADFVSLALAAAERQNLENQLRHSQKMEAVGLLAGGVAHDFSNLLTVMLVYTDLLLARLRSDPASVHFVEEIQRAAGRADALTRQLLAFSRKQVLNPKVLDLNGVVRDMENMLRPMIGEQIELVTTLAPALSCIKADRGQIEQVLMNLVVNARDAMAAAGRIRIATLNLGLERSALYRTAEPQETHFVLLSVSDTGVGMDEETLSRIFEPFFTTKQDGKGTGLGLSTVYGIVEQSGGQIEVESHPGLGTAFRIYFPAVHETIVQSESHSVIEDRPAANRETLLLVEDEDSLREAAVHALRDQGYHVLDVRNGIEAIRLCQKTKEHVHLLITDVVMPQMDGRELAAKISRLRPDTKILYVSGYAKGAILDKGELEPNSEFLAKPFRLSELLQKVREVLGTATRSMTAPPA